MDVLEQLLFDLQTSTDGSSSILSSYDIAENIVHHCTFNLNLYGTELDYALFFLTQSESPPNIIEFLGLPTKDKDIVKAKVVLLKFLASLIKQIGDSVDSSAKVIFSSCVSIFKKDDSNEVKAASLLPVKNLLHLSAGGFHLTEDDVQLDSLLALLISQYVNKKSTGGIRYNVLVTLGHLVQQFPYAAATIARVDQVAGMVISVFKSNFGSKTKTAPDLSTLAGAFSCLDRCLFEFEDRFTSDPAATTDLWKYLMMALSGMSNDSLYRFAVIGKALRVIKHHSFLFRRLVVLNMEASYRLVLVCYFSERDVCKKHAEEALIALLSEFSAAILTNTLHPPGDDQSVVMFTLANKVLMDIVQQFLKYLGSTSTGKDSETSAIATASASAEGEGKSSTRKISLGVKGITAVAPAIAVLCRLHSGSEDARNTSDCSGRVIGTLIRSCQNLLLQMAARERHLGGAGPVVLQHDSEVILRKAQFLSAVATTMHSLLCAVQGGAAGGDEGVGDAARDLLSHVDILTSNVSPVLLTFLLSSGVDIALAYSQLRGVATPSAARSALCVLLRAAAFSVVVPGIDDERVTVAVSCSASSVSSVLDEVLSTVVPLLLMRAMSRAEQGEFSEGQALADDDADQRLHVAYVPLWKELLGPSEAETIRLLRLMAEGSQLATTDDAIQCPSSYQQAVFPALINSLLGEVFKIIQAFDLSYILPTALSAVDEGDENKVLEEEGTTEEVGAPLAMLLPLPNNAADQELLLNLVTFLEAICPVLLKQFDALQLAAPALHAQVCEWVSMLLSEVVWLSTARPMVSGLYRLCSVVSTLHETLRQTRNVPQYRDEGSDQDGTSSGMEVVVTPSTSPLVSLSNILTTYFQETAQNIQHAFHHPELVLSALAMIFSAPVSLVTQPSLTKSTYLPLLSLSLHSGVQVQLAMKILFVYLDHDANSAYSQTHPNDSHPILPADEILTDQVLQSILPFLDQYLVGSSSSSSAGFEGKHVSKSVSKKKDKERSSSAPTYMVGGQEITASKGYAQGDGDSGGDVDGGGGLQLTVLRFLARLGGRNKFLLQSASGSIASSLQWDCFRRELTVDIPVTSELIASASLVLSQSQGQSQSMSQRSQQGSTVEVNVGAVVPRLVELSQDSSPDNRQLRLYAQECLHGIVLLMIGKAAQENVGDSSNDQFRAMFSTLFPTVIALSVSEDAVTKQLFDKLLIQIIHWLSSTSGGNALLSDVYASLMDHLMDGTSCDLNTSSSSSSSSSSTSTSVDDTTKGGNGSIVIRDKCVTAVVECFRWACKHSQVSKSNDSTDTGSLVATTSVDGILARLLTLSSHPIERKRLGAVRVLNQLYVYFREDMSLIYKYALRVIFVVLNAVKQPGGGAGGSQATCALAVSHYMKIIVRVSEKDALDAAYIRQGRWKVQGGGSNKKASSQSTYSLHDDLQHESDHPTYPFTLRDLASWLWHHITDGDYVFRRQCMLCLSELCSLLPCPSQASTQKQKGKTLSSKPRHLQAIANCLFSGLLLGSPKEVVSDPTGILEVVASGFVQPLSLAFRKGVVGSCREKHIGAQGFSPLGYPQFSCELSAAGRAGLLCPEEVKWLHALNGSLDSYNFLITCVEGCSGSDLFALSSDGNHVEDYDCMDTADVVDSKLGSKKRGRGAASDAVILGGHSVRPVHASGRVLMDNLFRFFACCFHRLCQDGVGGTPNSQAEGKAQERLLAEVLRRTCQLLTALLKSERAHFVSYLQSVGLLVNAESRGGTCEFAMFVQFVLMASLAPMQASWSVLGGQSTNLTGHRQSAQRQRGEESLDVFITEADEVLSRAMSSAEEGAKMRESTAKIGPQAKETPTTLFLFPCCQRGGDTVGGQSSGDGGSNDEEITVNLPIALKQLLCMADDALTLISAPLWATQLVCSLTALAPQLLELARVKGDNFSAFPVGAFSRTLALLQASGMLPRFYPDGHARLLLVLGARVVDTVFGSLSGGRGGGIGGAEVATGSALLQFAVDALCLDIVNSDDTPSNATSLMSILFSDDNSGSSQLHQFKVVTPKSIQMYGSALIDIFLRPASVAAPPGAGVVVSGTPGGENSGKGRCVKVLQSLVRRMERTASCLGHDNAEAIAEHLCAKTLLRKLLSGIPERAEDLTPLAVLEVVACMASLVSGQARGSLMSAEQTSLLLHIESLLPMTLRAKYLTGSLPPPTDPLYRSAQIIASWRSDVLAHVLAAFNGAAASSSSAVSSDSDDVVVERIVDAFGILPYVLPGGCTASCAFPVLSTAVDVMENRRQIAVEVVAGLEEVMAAKFPLKSTSLDASSQQGKDFARIFRAWLDSFSACGSLTLWQPLQASLREGSSHLYSSWIRATIKQFVQDIDYRLERGISTTALRVCQDALAVVFDPYQDLNVKFFYLDEICLPVLLRCSSASLQAMLCGSDGFSALEIDSGGGGGGSSLIKKLMDLITKHQALIPALSAGTCPIHSDDISTALLQVCCSFSIVETIYDRCGVEDLKGAVTQAFVGSGTAKGSELTQAICRAAHKMIRQEYSVRGGRGGNGATEHQYLVQRAHSSAFNALLIVVAKTQSEEKFFDNFLFIEKSTAPDQAYWSNVIDCHAFYSFEGSAKFSTKYLGGYFKREIECGGEEEEEDIDKSGTGLRKRKLLGVTGYSQAALQDSSQLLAESSLKRARVDSSCSSSSGGGAPPRRGLASQSQYLFSQSQNVLSSTSENPSDPFDAFSQRPSTVSQYHITSSQSEDPGNRSMDLDRAMVGLPGGPPIRGLDDFVIALELNHVNEQFCMGTMLRVIQRMHVLFGDKWLQEGAPVPLWITVCKNKLSDYSPLASFDATRDVMGDTANDRRNIRLFFLRLLMNQPVAAIAKKFLPSVLLLPVLQCCLHDLCGLQSGALGGTGSGSFHYFLRDVVFTLVDSDWTLGTSPIKQTDADEEDMFADMSAGGAGDGGESVADLRHLKASLLSHLLHCVCPEDGTVQSDAIVKENVNSICILIQTWVSDKGDPRGVSSGLNLSSLVSLISSSDAAPTGGAHAKATSVGSMNVKRRLYGYKILESLVLAGYPLLDKYGSPDSQKWGAEILRQVCNGCKFPRKEVSERSSSVGGAILHSFAAASAREISTDRHIPEAADFANQLERKLVSLLGVKNGYDTVAVCIRAVCKHHAAFLTRELLLKMLGGFGKLKSRTKVDFLDVLCVSTAPVSGPGKQADLSAFDGISVIQAMQPYIPALLGDVSTVAFGHGAKLKNIPMVQLLTLRLIKVHSKDCVRLNLLPDLMNGPSSGGAEGDGEASATRGGSLGLEKALSDDSLLVVRQEAYEMLMALHTELMVQLDRQELNRARLSDQVALVRVMLLRGLTDRDDRGMVRRTSDSATSGATSSIGADRDVPPGIRRQVFDFFQDHCGFSMCPVQRLVTLLTDLFDPMRNMFLGPSSSTADSLGTTTSSLRGFEVTDQWLRYSSYLLLCTNTATGDENGSAQSLLLFTKGLAPDNSFSLMTVDSSRRGGGSASSASPMFSFENTQSQLASLSQGGAAASQMMSQYFPTQSQSQSQGAGITSQAGGSLSKQGRTRVRRRGGGGLGNLLRGTQQFSWTQTQQEGAAGGGGQMAVGISSSGQGGTGVRSGWSGSSGVSAQERGFFTQYIGESSNTAAFSGSSTGVDRRSPSSSTFQVSLSQQEGSQVVMPAPVGLPSRFGHAPTQGSQDASMLTVVTQRVPLRYQVDTTTQQTKGQWHSQTSSREQLRKKQSQERSRQAARVTLYRRFRMGELPDICISAMDLLGPLQQICLRDSRVAAILFDELFQKLYTSAAVKRDIKASAARGDEAMHGKICHALHFALCGTLAGNVTEKTDSVSVSLSAVDPTVLTNTLLVNSMLSALRHCEMHCLRNSVPTSSPFDTASVCLSGMNIKGVTDTSIASLNFHNGIYLLEQHVLFLQQNNADSDVHRTLIQLGRLYDALKEKDVLTGMLLQLSHNEESRQALDVEISGGDFAEAIQLYNKLLLASEEADGGAEGVSAQEVEMWKERSLGCIGNLLDWEQLHEKVELLSDEASVAGAGQDADSRNFVMKLFDIGVGSSEGAGSSLTWLLPHYTKSMAKLGGHVVSPLRFSSACYGQDTADPGAKGGVLTQELWDETSDFLRRALQPAMSCSRTEMALFQHTKGYLEANLSADLAMCFASLGQWSRAQAYAGVSYEKFLQSWSSLHPSAVTARNTLLSSLQRVLEIEDTVSLLAPLGSSGTGTGIGRGWGNDQNSSVAEDMHLQLQTVLRRWQHSLPQDSDPLNVWDDLSRVRSLCLAQHIQRQADAPMSPHSADTDLCARRRAMGAIAAADHLSNLHVEVAITAIRHNVLQVGKEQLGVAGTYRKAIGNIEHQQLGKKKVKGQILNMSLNEVLTVYAFNQRGVETAIQGRWKTAEKDDTGDWMDAVIPRYQKTMDLLASKQQLCEAACSVVAYRGVEKAHSTEWLELLRVQLMQAEWSASWGSFLREHGGNNAASACREKFDLAYGMFQDVASRAETVALASPSTADIVSQSGLEFLKFSGEAHGKLAKHCDELLTLNSDSGVGAEDGKALALVAINSYLNGMYWGDKMSRARVLRLLSLAGEYLLSDSEAGLVRGKSKGKGKTSACAKQLHTTHAAVTDMTDLLQRMRSVPAWMFLRFSAQIMGCVDRPEGPLAVSILEHIAETYPRALYYPFKVSYPSLSNEGRAKVNAKLAGLLKDDLSDVFVQSLVGLTHPELRWTDGLKSIITLLELKKVSEAEAALDDLRESCAELEWPGVGDKIGEYNAKYARYRSKRAKGRGGAASSSAAPATPSQKKAAAASLTLSSAPAATLLASLSASFDVKSIRSLLVKAQQQEEEWTMKHKSGKVQLTEFSQWLAEFGALTLTLSSLQYAAGDPASGPVGTQYQYSSIEVPGQYAAAAEQDRPPHPTEHSMILAVDPQLLVMASIRKPKRMGLVGSGGEVVHFLVKGGEDLRNDQRVEELFVLMNRIVREDAGGAAGGRRQQSWSEGASARCFCVIPMTPRVGLLEWVKNTIPLKAVITSEMQRDDHFVSQNPNFITRSGEGELQFLRASKERDAWLKDSSYHKMFKNAKNDQAEKLYRKLTNLVPDDFLRRRFVRMSPSAEAFLTLRTECAKSLAVSSLFGYILGLGDRHLDNLLLDQKTGGIVQIDFGICFGMGTSMLHVPELLPFRLTRQMTGMFRPLDGTNLLRHYMIGVLRAIRADAGKQVLSNALEVYVNDPVVDWLKGPLDKESGEGEGAGSYAALRDDVTWEPRRRIANAVRKTEGAHPVELMVQDLELNNGVRAEKSLSALSAILWHSVEGVEGRKSGGSRGGEVDCATQVDLLLAVATDPNILVRQWVGLLPWI